MRYFHGCTVVRERSERNFFDPTLLNVAIEANEYKQSKNRAPCMTGVLTILRNRRSIKGIDGSVALTADTLSNSNSFFRT